MLRLLADDLTGALDSAAPFVGRFGPIPTYWDETAATAGSLALDGETRDLEPDRARERIAVLAPLLAGADISFLKIDSRLRGHPAAEIATCARAFRTVVIAPAFPAEGRVTRQGRQLVRDASGTWQPVPLDLPAALAAAGLPVRLGPPESGKATLCDAETDDDLARIATTPGLEPPTLWCGTGGLARALAGATPPQLVLTRQRSVLIVAGTPHGATLAQVEHLIPRPGVTLHRLDLAACTSPEAARGAHARLIETAASVEPPGLLIATGGETLLRLCLAIGAQRLDLRGEVAVGVPVSRMVGGRWDGATVISKSGGFGAPDLLADLLEGIAHG